MCEAVSAFPSTSNARDFHVTLLSIPPGLALRKIIRSAHTAFMCFVWISEQTAIISIYSIN